MVEDRELFDRWRDGDAVAGNTLFERHFDAVYRFFRTKVAQDAEDLVQQTFLACLRARDGFRHDATFRTYLFTAARSKLFDHLRKRPSRAAVDFGVTSLVDLGISPSGQIARNENHRAALAALRSLPLDLQIALELYHVEKLRGPQLAHVLEIPEGTVRSRLRRARELLEERVARAHEDGGLLPTSQDTIDNLEAWATSLPIDRERVLDVKSQHEAS